ncbi:hypothetical protein [Bradyrhizobium sp. URHC0002]
MRAGSIVLFAHILVAFCASEVRAAPCIAPPLSPAAIEQFKASPEALLPPNADTRALEAQVRDLAGTDASLAANLIELAKTTTPRFRTAIAAGLAQAAIACQTIDQQAALTIQQAVASFDEEGFQNSFAAVSGDLSTAATIAATNSANSSVGSVIVVNPNVGGRSSTNPGGGGSTAFFQINSTIGASTATIAPTNTTTSASPVSATR